MFLLLSVIFTLLTFAKSEEEKHVHRQYDGYVFNTVNTLIDAHI